MRDAMKDVADALEATLRAQGTPERAVKDKAYLESTLTHLGASVPATRRAVRELRRARPDLTRPHRASGLTVREAIKHLPPARQQRILAARTRAGS